MEMKRALLLGTIAICLAACGGGGGSSKPQSRPSGEIGGTAFDNVLMESNIDVYGLDGTLLGSGVTDLEGNYSIELAAVPSQPVKIVASNGRYKEEATNTLVHLDEGDHLYGYVNYTQGGNITTSITLFTSIAAGYAEYLMGLGVPENTAIDNANSSVSQMIGVNIVNTVPVDITDANNAKPSLDPSLRYSFFTAAASPFTAWVSRENGRPQHDFYNSIRFATLAYEDIAHDGFLNGQSAKGTVSMGVVAFDENTYRHALAQNMLIIADSPNNRSGMKPADLLAAATSLNNSNHVAFGTADVVPIDAEKPIVTNPSWFDGETVAGDAVTLSVDVSDTVGVSTVVFSIDGVDFLAPDPENPEITFDTTPFTDAVYPVSVTVTNFAGGQKIYIRDLTIANAGIAISDVHPADGEHIRGTYLFRAAVTDPIAVTDVLFKLDENLQYSPSDLNAPQQSIDTTAVIITEGPHTFDIIAENQGGFTTEYNGTFIIDNTVPVIDWPMEDGIYLSGNFNFSATLSDNIQIASANLFWDGELLTNFVQGGTPTVLTPVYTINTLQDFEGEHSIAIEIADKAGAITTETKTVFLDWNPPQVGFTTPSGIVASEDFNVSWEASDTNGIAGQEIYVAGEKVVELGADDRSYTITPMGSDGVDKEVKLVVTDLAGKVSTAVINARYRYLPPTTGGISVTQSGYMTTYTIPLTNRTGGDISSFVDEGAYLGVGMFGLPVYAAKAGFYVSGNYLKATYATNGYCATGYNRRFVTVKGSVTIIDQWGNSSTRNYGQLANMFAGCVEKPNNNG